MAKKRSSQTKREPLFDDLTPQAKQGIGAVALLVVALFFTLSSLGFAGVVGDMTHAALRYLFGFGFVLAPAACLLYVVALLRPRADTGKTSLSKIVGDRTAFSVITWALYTLQ